MFGSSHVQILKRPPKQGIRKSGKDNKTEIVSFSTSSTTVREPGRGHGSASSTTDSSVRILEAKFGEITILQRQGEIGETSSQTPAPISSNGRRLNDDSDGPNLPVSGADKIQKKKKKAKKVDHHTVVQPPESDHGLNCSEDRDKRVMDPQSEDKLGKLGTSENSIASVPTTKPLSGKQKRMASYKMNETVSAVGPATLPSPRLTPSGGEYSSERTRQEEKASSHRASNKKKIGEHTRVTIVAEKNSNTDSMSVKVSKFTQAPTNRMEYQNLQEAQAVAFPSNEPLPKNGTGRGGNAKFAEYLPSKELEQGVKNGTYFAAPLRVNAFNRYEAYVTIEGLPLDVLISGLLAQNRCVDGDVVYVQLDPPHLWPRVKGQNGENEPQVALPELQPKHEERRDFVCLLKDSPGRRPSGKVVGIQDLSQRRDNLVGRLEITGGSFRKTAENEEEREVGGRDRGEGTLLFVPTDARFPKMIVFVNKLPEELRSMVVNGRGEEIQELLVGARLDRWKPQSYLPHASVFKSLGQAGLIETETTAVLFQYNIHSTEFPPEALACLPRTPWRIPDEEIRRRQDFRETRVFSIDPLTARDLDDALSVERLPGGNLRVGVHIADVSHFVRPETALDEEAGRRSTSVYMVRSVLPMLPRLLCEELCSLNPGVDRLAFSVVWEMTMDGEVVDQWLGKSIIRSCCKLAYEHAQEMIDGKFPRILEEEAAVQFAGVEAMPLDGKSDRNQLLEGQKDSNSIDISGGRREGNQAMVLGMENEGSGLARVALSGQYTWKEVAGDVRTLHSIAEKLRDKRFANGALTLQTMKLQFRLDEGGMPIDVREYRQASANFLVEEFMLLANMTVAKVISRAFPDMSLLRRHPDPSARKLKAFISFCEKLGIKVGGEAQEEDAQGSQGKVAQKDEEVDGSKKKENVDSAEKEEKVSAREIQSVIHRLRELLANDPVLFRAMLLHATKPMQLAQYFCTGDFRGREEEWVHFALATPYYTHFTSPIRRYADLVVHRTLAAVLDAEKELDKLRLGKFVRAASEGAEAAVKAKKKAKKKKNKSGVHVVPEGEEGEKGGMDDARSWGFFSGVEFRPLGLEEGSENRRVQDVVHAAGLAHRLPCLERLSIIATRCNERKAASRSAQEASDKIHLCALLKAVKGVLSAARVIAVGPRFAIVYIEKFGLERNVYFDGVSGLRAEWLESTGAVVLDVAASNGGSFLPENNAPPGGRQKSGSDSLSSSVPELTINASGETAEKVVEEFADDDLANHVKHLLEERRVEGEDEAVEEVSLGRAENAGVDSKEADDGWGGCLKRNVEPNLLPLTLKVFSPVSVYVYATGGGKKSMDVAAKLYISSYITQSSM